MPSFLELLVFHFIALSLFWAAMILYLFSKLPQNETLRKEGTEKGLRAGQEREAEASSKKAEVYSLAHFRSLKKKRGNYL